MQPARIRSALAAIILGLCVVPPAPGSADTLRVATYNVGLSRDGAGVLIRDLGREPDDSLSAILEVICTVRPDIILLSRFDHDINGRALAAFSELLRNAPDGIDYGYSFVDRMNSGDPSGLDLDADGMLMGWNDAFGWGKFPGHGGMAILSRFPIDQDAARTFRELAWNALPGATMPRTPEGGQWPNSEASSVMRLSSRSHWDIPVELPGDRRLHLLASNPTPPLFDGEEGMNRLRNRDEILFWVHYLDGTPMTDDNGHSAAAPDAPVIVLGDLNKDPMDGAGLADGIGILLRHDRLQDPKPSSPGAALAANPDHRGPPELDTADWRDGDGPGNLRVDYVLPDASLSIADSGVYWPEPGTDGAEAAQTASRHRLVWVDLDLN